MITSDGRHVGLNLGPLPGLGGARVGLNLGIDWDDGPGPEPVPATLRSSTALCWRDAGRIRVAALVGWGYSDVLTRAADTAWGRAPLITHSAQLPWGLTPLLKGGCVLRWRQSTPKARLGCELGWGALPLTWSSLTLKWRAHLLGARASAVLTWASGLRGGRSLDLNWRCQLPLVSAGRRLPWGHPGTTRWGARLPWRPASPLPWIVRPAKPPGPDPEPQPTFPPGNLIGLNLGCAIVGVPGLAPLNLGVTACYLVRPQRRTYVVINSVSVVRLPDRIPIQVESISISSSVDAWGSSYDIELADSAQLALLKPTAAGPRLIEINLNGYVWTAVMESYSGRREWSRTGATLAGRSRTALLAGPYAPGRVKATTEERSMAQLVDEELADTGFTASYDTVDWMVPPGAWFYDALPALDAISRLAEASGAVVQSDPAEPTLRVRARYPDSPWDWRDRTPAHVLQEDIITNESLQMRSAPLYDVVVVTGELAGKGVTCKVRRAGEAGQLFAQQVSSPLINTAAAGAERGRNILADRGEQAAIDLVVPLFTAPLRPGEVGRILPLDLVEVVGEEGTWHGLCTAVRTEARIGEKAVVIEQTITLERHYSDAD